VFGNNSYVAYFKGDLLDGEPAIKYDSYTDDDNIPLKLNASPQVTATLSLVGVHYTYKDLFDFLFSLDTLMVNGVVYENVEAPNISKTKGSDLREVTIKLSKKTNDPYADEGYEFISELPSLSTTTPYSIDENSAFSGGTIISTGGETIIRCGACWSLTENPTIANSHTEDILSENSFTSEITGLDSETTYYVRAYAENINGLAYGQNKLLITTEIPVIIELINETFDNWSGSEPYSLYPTGWVVTTASGNPTSSSIYISPDAGGCKFQKNSSNDGLYLTYDLLAKLGQSYEGTFQVSFDCVAGNSGLSMVFAGETGVVFQQTGNFYAGMHVSFTITTPVGVKLRFIKVVQSPSYAIKTVSATIDNLIITKIS
jgi:hypothetical protein